jgi:hypothetical protein
MTTKLFSRTALRQQLKDVFASPQKILENMPLTPLIPTDLSNWLSKLCLLHGVPFNYLVPDESMLPPESLRFFYLDENWINALADGAFSIGRNLTAEENSTEFNVDKAVWPMALSAIKNDIPKHRARLFGLQASEAPSVISGFLLRSAVVREYPDMGVYAFPTDKATDPVLPVLRFEQLGPDTLICLISGDAMRFDIHQAPQALHYGIDCYEHNCTVKDKPARAVKNLYTFSIKDTPVPGSKTKKRSITMSKTSTPTDVSSTFRNNSRRVMNIDALAEIIATNNSQTVIDSAEMGFEMIEGVGKVSFKKQ